MRFFVRNTIIRLRRILFNRIYKKVSIVSSAVFIAIAAIVTAGVLSYAQKNYRTDLRRKVTEFAVIGGEQAHAMFNDALRLGHVTTQQLFDEEYQKISLEEFRATYVDEKDRERISDTYIRLLMDRLVEKDVDEYYRYHTTYDVTPYLVDRAGQFQEPFLETENIDYAVLIDRNGYIPFHHAVNSRKLTGDLETDTFGNRTKRIWKNTLGLTQVPGKISYYYYRRDTGTPYLNVNVPIMIEGRHWGAFVVGYNATEIDVAVAWLRRNAILIIVAVAALTVAIYSMFIVISLKPLSVLLHGVQRIDKGNLDVSIPVRSEDEIGYLSGAFNGMVTSIKTAHAQLELSAEDLRISNEKLAEYNRTLSERVEERTRDLNKKNDELEVKLQQIVEMQQQLIIQEKMASLGNLVAGVAHEVNSPIGAVHSAADSSRRCIERISAFVRSNESVKGLRAGDELEKSLQILKNNNEVTAVASERITSIVRSLKTFARLDEAEYQQADIRVGLDSTLLLIEHELKNRIAVTRDYGDVPDIGCYPNQLNQVFMNVLMNAAQAIDGKGTIIVKTFVDDDDVVIQISDDGCGMAPEVITRVFDPGFTTKGVGVGTGLGLSICHTIIQKHHGKIKVASDVGKGTTFSIIVPGVAID